MLRFSPDCGKNIPVQVVVSDLLPVTGHVDATAESLHALPAGKHDGFLSWSVRWVVAELSHPAFCHGSGRALGQACSGCVEVLISRMQRVRVEMIESCFCSAVVPEIASFSARLQVTEEGWLGERIPGRVPKRRLSLASSWKLWAGPVPTLIYPFLWSWMMVSSQTGTLQVKTNATTTPASFKHGMTNTM